jgi:PEP-CTERM motif
MFRENWSRLLPGPAVVLIAAALLACAPTASAVLIVNDTWQDGTDDDPASPTYSENGTDADADGDLESAWFQGGGGELNPAGPGGPLEMVMADNGTSSASWTTYFTPEGSEVALNNPGDKLRATWVFTTHDVNVENGSQNFRIALVDSPAGSQIAANGTPGNAIYKGYGIFGNMGETLGHSGSFELVERTDPNASDSLLSGSGAWEDENLNANGGTNGNPGYSDNTEYTFVMELTRNASNQINVFASMTGGNLDGVGSMSASATDIDPAGFAFDTFALRPSNANSTTDQFDTSLFRVEFLPIPEPASFVLLGLGGVALAVRRRRGR